MCSPTILIVQLNLQNSGVRSPLPPVYCNHYGIYVEPFDKLYHVGRDKVNCPKGKRRCPGVCPHPAVSRRITPILSTCTRQLPRSFSIFHSQFSIPLDLEYTPSATLRAKEGDSHDHRRSEQTVRHHAGHTALLRAHRPDPTGTAHEKRHPRLRPDLVQLDRVY